ncbi:hypothetical protein DAPPUDRAFT_107153 [Daphnia pulex]|uniref:Uncharacterized protein n=1 Tax=Daphnia pulex TaxID=6669 RepID=E9GW52_DAPPU|nr:hypothetical protein DAPPUDRAFT_107153 [Daphnia pulex]|eukprot:EFX76284.1 hypothetical protein DAPPUDRAFT_107153 [Daphnia pulex]
MQDVNVVPSASSTTSSSSAGLVSVVVVCMTIMAVCALVYFAIRCYFDERRWRASAMLCKCLPPASAASLVECGNPCRYVERRAVNVAVQTGAPFAGAEVATGATAAANCWPMSSDVGMSEAKRISGCAFSSPLANDNEAIPNWRPPATGSSQRHSSAHHYRHLQKSSQRQKHRHHRQIQRQYYREVQHQQDDECQHYPLRRVRPVSMMPSIQVQSPSSSESYSILAMSTNSKSAALNKEFTPMTFSGSDGDDGMSQIHHQYSKSGLSEGHSYYGSTNPYHPRYNTPVSEIHHNDVEVVVATADIEQVVPVVEMEEKENNEGREFRPDLMNLLMDRMEGRKWSRRSPSACSAADGLSTSAEHSTTPAATTTTTTNTTANNTTATTVQLVDEATQSCPSSVGGWMAGNLKGCQTSKTNSSCSLNVAASAGLALPLDIARSGLPLKGTFPSFEVLPGGRLISRRTQTDNASLASLDWDPYESERLRSGTMADLYDEDFEGGGDGYHRLTNVDEGVEGMTSSATMLASSHVSADTTLQASRISHRSASSPYVLCFECSDDFGVARRSEYFVPRHTSSSSPASRNANRRRSVAPPPSPPAPPNLSAGLSPQHSTSSSHHLQPDGQDGRSSKAVRPRRK